MIARARGTLEDAQQKIGLAVVMAAAALLLSLVALAFSARRPA